MTSGWKLTPACRERLLDAFAPSYERIVADHVTFKGGGEGCGPGGPAPIDDAQIVGRADDRAGVEALVVAIAGSTDRPDGSTWHLTWSLAAGRSAKESNDVIAALGWTNLDPVDLELEPASW